MIKTGIYKIEHLKKKDTTLFCKKLKNVSITLYDQILKDPQADKLAERILLLFSDERGAYKRTYQNRFEVFDESVIAILKENFTPSDPLSFHDVSISDGRTALDFFTKMVSHFPRIDYFASDYNPSVYVLEKGSLKVVLSHTQKILEITYPPFVFNKMKRDRFLSYPVNHLILWFIEQFLVKPLVGQYQQGAVKAKELRLFSPKVLHKAQQDERFKLGQHDLLQPFKKPVHSIRAMNVLNLFYFSEEEFKKVVRNLYQGLENNGMLITGSNQDAETLVHGGIYQKHEAGFKKLLQSGNGSPIDALIGNFKV